MLEKPFMNPFRPGAGHNPPYLAGRQSESSEFSELLDQDVILTNPILTGLRGVGKTVLLDTFKPIAVEKGWLWAGTDLSESTSVTEEHLAIRILTDLSVVTAPIMMLQTGAKTYLRQQSPTHSQPLNYRVLRQIYEQAPGLVADKLKTVLRLTWRYVKAINKTGVVFAYDEAQNLADHAAKEQYPLSLLLDVFQSIQRQDIPFMLALTGLPTLLPKLVEARTYAERMFHVISLGPLAEDETRQAIERPIQKEGCPVTFTSGSVDMIWRITKGYPYFVQFVCREVYDVWVQNIAEDEELQSIPEDAIMHRLDDDFFVGRWSRATDRQRELLTVIAWLENSDREFTVREIVEKSKEIYPDRPFSNSHANQMLGALGDRGLVYKNRHGKYSFAVPLLDRFIMRQLYSDVGPPVEVTLPDDF